MLPIIVSNPPESRPCPGSLHSNTGLYAVGRWMRIFPSPAASSAFWITSRTDDHIGRGYMFVNREMMLSVDAESNLNFRRSDPVVVVDDTACLITAILFSYMRGPRTYSPGPFGYLHLRGIKESVQYIPQSFDMLQALAE